MATKNQNNTATSGNLETLDQVLERIQRMYIPERFILVWEDWDWIVVLQCMQDHGLFKSNPKRPPLGAFIHWLEKHNIPQYRTHASVYEMSLANRSIRNARYPWADVVWEPHVLRRWRILYRHLSKMLLEISCDTKPVS